MTTPQDSLKKSVLGGMTVKRAVILAVLLGVLLPALLGGGYLTRVLFQDRLTREIQHNLSHQTALIALGVRESLWALDIETANTLVDALMRDPSLVVVQVQDLNHGTFVQREMAERRVGKTYAAEQDVLYRNERIGSVRVELSDAQLRSQLGQQISLFISMLALQVTGSVVLILIVLHRRLGRPLHRLAGEVRRLARGELEVPVAPLRSDEIGEVEAQLETTRQALQGSLRSLEQKNQALEVDLRERMRVEAALRDREQRLRALVEQSPIAVIEFDLGWHVLDWNDAARRTFGLRREEALGCHLSLLFPDGKVDFLADVQQIGTSGLSRRCRNERKDGEQITCQWHLSLIRDAGGIPLRSVCLVEDVTERQRSEEEIRRLAAVVRLSTNLVVLTDATGRAVWANDAFRRGASFGEDELRGLPLLRLLGIDQPGDAAARLLTAVQTGEALNGLDLACRRRTGERYDAVVEVQALRAADGSLLQSIVVLTDVTERRRINEALRSLARIGGGHDPNVFLQQLLAAIGRGARVSCAYIAEHRRGGSEAEVLAAWRGEMLSSHSAHGSKAGSLAELVEAQGSVVVAQDAAAQLATARPLLAYESVEAVVAVPLYDGADRLIGHLALTWHDANARIEEAQSLAELAASRAGSELARLQALDELRHSEQKFSSIFQHSPIPLVLMRLADRSYLDVNTAALDVFRFTREQVLGRSIDELQLYEDAEDQRRLREMLEWDGYVDGADVRLRAADGSTLDCQVYVRRVMTTEPCVLIATVDVTEQRAAQRQVEQFNATLEQRVVDRTRQLATANAELATALERLQLTQDELVRTEKLAALGALVAGVAHELNTPIGNSVMVASTLRDQNRGFRQQMEAGLKRSDLDRFVTETESAADIMLRNLHRAADLIQSFKQVAVDQTSSQRREFELAEVAREIVLTLNPAIRKTPYKVELEIAPDILMDSFPGPLGQVLTNLINNALMHAFEGRREGRVLITGMQQGDEVIVRCRDDGVGIPAANLRRIFDPFFTTRMGREGTGLGLNIVHNIVTAVLGGDIRVDSELGAGACFTLTLPRVAPDKVREPGAG